MLPARQAASVPGLSPANPLPYHGWRPDYIITSIKPHENKSDKSSNSPFSDLSLFNVSIALFSESGNNLTTASFEFFQKLRCKEIIAKNCLRSLSNFTTYHSLSSTWRRFAISLDGFATAYLAKAGLALRAHPPLSSRWLSPRRPV